MPLSTDALSAYDIGASAPDFATNAAIAARNLYCTVYRNFPDWAASSFPSNPAVQFRRGLSDRLCRKFPQRPNAPTNNDFSGGQCNTTYTVRIPYTYTFVGFGGQQFTQSGILNLGGFNGPILSTVAQLQPSGSGVALVATVIGAGSGNSNTLSGPAGIRYDYVGSFQVTRTDGNKDNCGDPVRPLPPASPSPDDLIDFPPIPDGNGGTRVVPVFLPIPVLIKPTIDVNVGPFNIEIGPFDVNILPNADFNIDFDPSFPQPTLPPNQPPPPLPPGRPTAPTGGGGGGGGSCPDVDLGPVLDRLEEVDNNIDSLKPTLEEIKECACEPETEVLVTSIGSGSGGRFTLPDRTFVVRLNITQPPSSGKSQSSEGDAQDVIFAGWYAFGSGPSDGDRQPVSFGLNVFECPEWANRFSFSLNFGAQGAAFAESLVEL